MKTIVEPYPHSLKIQRLFLNGKTIGERDAERDKEWEKGIISRLFHLSVDTQAIAAALKKEVNYIEEIILEAKKQTGNETSN